jgi:hypothetical protein
LYADIWQEHQNAVNVDYINGIGVPDGCGIGGSDFRRGIRSADHLKGRARAVRVNPAAFSKYTVMFVDELFVNMRSLALPAEEAASELDPTNGRNSVLGVCRIESLKIVVWVA